MPFTIAYIAGEFPKRSETFVYREVRALRRRGWEVRTLSLNEPKDGAVPEFADLNTANIVIYGSGGSGTIGGFIAECCTHPIRALRTCLTAARDALHPGEPMSARARLKLIAQAAAAIGASRRLAGAGCRHLHAHFAHAPATLAMYAATQLGIPWSFTGHANDLFQRRALLKRKLERAAFVSCISEWHFGFYRSTSMDAARLHVVRCGVPVEEWTPRELRNTRPTIQLLTVCRLVEKKGVDTLLRALQEFGRRTGRAWRLTIAGDGPESDKLIALADELGVSGSCAFLGAVNNDHVRELLGQADYFALPCREDSHGDRDGIPVVLMEAMACGVPVISGDLPAIRELIAHRESGMLVDGTQFAQIADVLEELERDDALRKRVARGGRARVETEFALDENVGRLEALFKYARN